MSVATATRPRFGLAPRHLAWLPALLLLAWGLFAAAGVSLVPNSTAASTATVTASVALDIHIGGTCPSYSNAFGAMPDNTESTLGGCTVTFGTNNGATSTLKVESARDNAGQVMFCRAADNDVNCGAGGFTDAGANQVGPLGADKFGVLTTAIGACTTPSWTLNRYNPVPPENTAGAGVPICSMVGTGDGSYTLSFRAHPDTVTAGSYTGQALLTVEAT
jgi:hypothetical protein